jgi:hypothetical protein
MYVIRSGAKATPNTKPRRGHKELSIGLNGIQAGEKTATYPLSITANSPSHCSNASNPQCTRPSLQTYQMPLGRYEPLVNTNVPHPDVPAGPIQLDQADIAVDTHGEEGWSPIPAKVRLSHVEKKNEG